MKEIVKNIHILTITKESNTLNPKFYRGSPNVSTFYSKEIYDFFTFNNRFMGAHSGSSSDDLIFMFGFGNDNNSLYLNRVTLKSEFL